MSSPLARRQTVSSPKKKLVVEMADGKTRKYTVAASVADKRLAEHLAMVASLGTGHLYKRAYIA
jgi:hypothetical protein